MQEICLDVEKTALHCVDCVTFSPDASRAPTLSQHASASPAEYGAADVSREMDFRVYVDYRGGYFRAFD